MIFVNFLIQFTKDTISYCNTILRQNYSIQIVMETKKLPICFLLLPLYLVNKLEKKLKKINITNN